jgi:hypothetical protein
MIPRDLHYISLLSLTFGVVCAIIIVIDEFRHPQKMWIMNVVWPVTALFGAVLWLFLYLRYGRLAAKDCAEKARHDHKANPAKNKPFGAMVAEAASHCGAGCSLGDLCAEALVVLFPVIPIWFGWHTIFSEKIFAIWVLDFIFAYAFGIVFQYFTIVPMRGLGFWDGVWAAIKADTLSLISWQVGMYGLMAAAQFWVFLPVFGVRLDATIAEFWFVMQVAMLFGFATAYPVNWALLRLGVKEQM